jgi:hypothetical protein
MSGSTNVTLTKSHTPIFPPCCVVCGAPNPGKTARFVTWGVRWWVWLIFLPSEFFSVKVPACPFCGWRLQFVRLLNSVIIIAAALVAAWYIWPYVKDHVPRGLRLWAQVGIALFVLLPKFIYDVVYPPAFDATIEKDRVTYEFRHPGVAAMFAGQNRNAMVGDNLFDFPRNETPDGEEGAP